MHQLILEWRPRPHCNVLRDDGMSYGDCVEPLIYPFFRKMVEERSRPPASHPGPIPAAFTLLALVGNVDSAPFAGYRQTHEELGGPVGVVALKLATAERSGAA